MKEDEVTRWDLGRVSRVDINNWNLIICSNTLSPKLSFLLFEISAILFIYKHQIQEILDTKPVIDIGIRGGQVRLPQEQSDWNYFPLDWSSIHDLKLANSFLLSLGIRSWSNHLFFYNIKLHVLNLDSHLIEKDLAVDTVFEVVV